MNILKIVEALQSYSEDIVAYKLDSRFAHAATKAVELLVEQGEQIADLENRIATVNGGWIPVSLGFLPEPGQRVLTTDGAFVGEMYIDKRGKWRRYNVNDTSLIMALDVLWWMPMPDPPRDVIKP